MFVKVYMALSDKVNNLRITQGVRSVKDSLITYIARKEIDKTADEWSIDGRVLGGVLSVGLGFGLGVTTYKESCGDTKLATIIALMVSAWTIKPFMYYGELIGGILGAGKAIVLHPNY